ncbi:MAG: hypothetical protein ACJ74O_18955 [Frankiaceae bacterium]
MDIMDAPAGDYASAVSRCKLDEGQNAEADLGIAGIFAAWAVVKDSVIRRRAKRRAATV